MSEPVITDTDRLDFVLSVPEVEGNAWCVWNLAVHMHDEVEADRQTSPESLRTWIDEQILRERSTPTAAEEPR